jgi:hypothetical protein
MLDMFNPFYFLRLMATKISKSILDTVSVSNAGQSNGLPTELEQFATDLYDKNHSVLVGKTTGELFVQTRQKFENNAPVTDAEGKPVNETVCFVEVQYTDTVLKVKMNGLLKAETVEEKLEEKDKDGKGTGIFHSTGNIFLPAKTVKFRCLKGPRKEGGNWYAAMLTGVCTPLEAKITRDSIVLAALTPEQLAAQNAAKQPA